MNSSKYSLKITGTIQSQGYTWQDCDLRDLNKQPKYLRPHLLPYQRMFLGKILYFKAGDLSIKEFGSLSVDIGLKNPISMEFKTLPNIESFKNNKYVSIVYDPYDMKTLLSTGKSLVSPHLQSNFKLISKLFKAYLVDKKFSTIVTLFHKYKPFYIDATYIYRIAKKGSLNKKGRPKKIVSGFLLRVLGVSAFIPRSLTHEHHWRYKLTKMYKLFFRTTKKYLSLSRGLYEFGKLQSRWSFNQYDLIFRRTNFILRRLVKYTWTLYLKIRISTLLLLKSFKNKPKLRLIAFIKDIVFKLRGLFVGFITYFKHGLLLINLLKKFHRQVLNFQSEMATSTSRLFKNIMACVLYEKLVSLRSFYHQSNIVWARRSRFSPSLLDVELMDEREYFTEKDSKFFPATYPIIFNKRIYSCRILKLELLNKKNLLTKKNFFKYWYKTNLGLVLRKKRIIFAKKRRRRRIALVICK